MGADISSLLNEKSSIEQKLTTDITNNNIALNDLGAILNSSEPNLLVEQPTYTSEHQNAITTSWKANYSLADTYKQLNITTESLKKAHYRDEEKKSLKSALTNAKIITDLMEKKNKMPQIDTKTRIIEINNKDFREKQILINRLMYLIYFIIYSIALSSAFAIRLISLQTLSIMFLIGLILLIYMFIISGNSEKTYTNTVISEKKCPNKCSKK
jgi:hypothetical protein